MTPIRCKLGLHDWSVWYSYGALMFQNYTRERQCFRCGKVEKGGAVKFR